MRTHAPLLAGAVLALTAAPAAAQTLKVGDAAPPLAITEWVKGDAVGGFEAGKAYLVEFWATW